MASESDDEVITMGNGAGSGMLAEPLLPSAQNPGASGPSVALQPTPGSNVTRIYGISDCVIAVAFTLFVSNIRLAPPGLNNTELKSFIAQDMLVDIVYYCGAYLVVASSWIS